MHEEQYEPMPEKFRKMEETANNFVEEIKIQAKEMDDDVRKEFIKFIIRKINKLEEEIPKSGSYHKGFGVGP